MTTERVASPPAVSGLPSMTRRWDAARRLMRERGISALIAYGTEDWLGGHARWFTDVPTHNGYGRTVVFHADGPMDVIDQGPFGARRRMDGDEYHRGVGEMIYTSFFSSVDYTTRYQGELVRDIVKKRGYRTIGFVVPGTMPHGLMSAVLDGFEGLTVIDVTPQIDRLIALKSEEELELLRRCGDHAGRDLRQGAQGHQAGHARRRHHRDGLRGRLGARLLAGHLPRRLGAARQAVVPGRPAFPGPHPAKRRQPELPGRSERAGRLFHRGRPHHRARQGVAATARQLRSGEGSAGLFRFVAQAGIACRDLAKAHDDFMAKRGLPKELRLYAHGQGYDMVERPLVRADEPMSIEKGMCLAVHPNYALDDLFMIVCDNYIVGASGSDRIHKTERKVFEVY